MINITIGYLIQKVSVIEHLTYMLKHIICGKKYFLIYTP